MARRYGRRRYRRYRRRPWYQKKYSAIQLAGKALSGVSYLKSLVNAEKHLFDTINTGSTPSSAGTITHLTAVPEGDTQGARDGLSILANGNYLSGEVTINASATATFLRIMLVVDKQQVSDTAPAVADVIDSSSSLLWLAPLNNLNLGRFSVLHDRLIRVDSDDPLKSFKKYCRFGKHGMHIRYNAALGSDIEKNGFYIILVSSEAVNSPTVKFFNRFRFYDN